MYKTVFVNAAASYFELQDEQIEEVLNAIEVIHPYGSIGELYVSGTGQVTGYAPELAGGNIYSAAKRIRTFTEGVADAELLDSIKNPLGQAEIVIFLGFSFIDITMQILKPESARASRVLATAKGRSEDTRNGLRRLIERDFTRYNANGEFVSASGRSVEMFDGKCFELFYEFDRYLANSQSA